MTISCPKSDKPDKPDKLDTQTWADRRDAMRPWLEVVGRFGRLDVSPLYAKLETDPDFVGTLEALLKIGPDQTVPRGPWDAFEVVRNHCVLELQVLCSSPLASRHEPSAADVYCDPSPFNVPAWALDNVFPPKADLCIKQFYDCLQVGGDRGAFFGTPFRSGSVRLFGNTNIGYALMTNLQVPGQLNFDDKAVLLTSWWLTTLDSWKDAESMFARSWLTLTVGDKPQAVLPALPLWHRRQPLLVKVPPRYNFSARFDFSPNSFELPTEGMAIPIWLFVEGWGIR